MLKCDDCGKVEVCVGESNPSIVICGECNGGTAVWNCVDVGNHSCDCSHCEPEISIWMIHPLRPFPSSLPIEDWDDDTIPF